MTKIKINLVLYSIKGKLMEKKFLNFWQTLLLMKKLIEKKLIKKIDSKEDNNNKDIKLKKKKMRKLEICMFKHMY